jgi:Zn-dependent peptidase ImmA (M78 family)
MRNLKTLQICGQEIQVLVASAEEVPALSDKYGYAETAAGKIYLNRENPPSMMSHILVHEILHVFLEVSGLGQFLFRGKDAETLEEIAIRLAAPHVVALLRENGSELWCVEGAYDANDPS